MDNRPTEDQKLQFEEIENVEQENLNSEMNSSLNKMQNEVFPTNIKVQYPLAIYSIFGPSPIYKIEYQLSDNTTGFIYRKIEDVLALRDSI